MPRRDPKVDVIGRRRQMSKHLSNRGLTPINDIERIPESVYLTKLKANGKLIIASELQNDPKQIGYDRLNRKQKIAALLKHEIVFKPIDYINYKGARVEGSIKRLQPSRYDQISEGIPAMPNIPVIPEFIIITRN